MIIDINQVAFSNISAVDDFGRVFFYQGRVFRAIYEIQKDYCLSLIKSDLFEELLAGNYIPETWITDFKLEGYALVLEHELLNETKPQHWSFEMYKDVALFLLRMNKLCNKYGYEIKDGHPYNVFFKINNPVFIDIGSIVPTKETSNWSAFEQFIIQLYIPLLLWEKGEYFLTKKLIIYPLPTIPTSNPLDSCFIKTIENELFDFIPYYIPKSIISISSKYNGFLLIRLINKILRILLRRNFEIVQFKKVLKSISKIEERIIQLNQPVTKSIWEDYHNFHRKDRYINTSYPRFERIINLVKEKAPEIKTSLDLAGNQGVFSYLISQQIKLDRIILTDYDEKAIGVAYDWFKKNKIDIQPYLFNFMIPFYEEEVRFFKSDIVFALAITHHLILTQNFKLVAIFEKIARYTKKYVIIEFMPIGLWGGGEYPEVPEWYTLEWFRAEFRKRYEIIHEEKLEVNRIVFIGKLYKKN